ncbi:MAG: hypothetical protein AAF601_03270 [Pseudomonadota bacterium]
MPRALRLLSRKPGKKGSALGKALKFQHWHKIRRLFSKRKGADLTAFLHTLGGRGFDVAGAPFRLLDEALSSGAVADLQQMTALAEVTRGGQPRLLRAVLSDLSGAALDDLVRDTDAHPMTRFEAMGWQVFLRRRGALPETGPAVGEVFQFWDDPTPPAEITAGHKAWRSLGLPVAWYSEEDAADYVTQHFGADAAAQLRGLWHPALKSDLFRLYRLVQDGGLYADADSLPGPGAADFARHAGGGAWGAAMTHVPKCVAINGFLAGSAGAPVFAGFLEHVLRNLAERPVEGIFWLSGPGALTHYLWGADVSITLLPRGVQKEALFSQFDAPYKHTERNWRVFEHGRGMGKADGLAQLLRDVI